MKGYTTQDLIDVFQRAFAESKEVGTSLSAVARFVEKNADRERTQQIASVYRQARAAKAIAEKARAEAERIMKAAQEIGGSGLVSAVGIDALTTRAIEVTARICGVSTKEILGGSRRQEISDARKVAAAVLRSPAIGLSSPDIAVAIGLNNHTSVLYAIERVSEIPRLEQRAARVLRELGLAPIDTDDLLDGDDDTEAAA